MCPSAASPPAAKKKITRARFPNIKTPRSIGRRPGFRRAGERTGALEEPREEAREAASPGTAARPRTWALSRRAAPRASRRRGGRRRALQHHLPRERLVHPAQERAERRVVAGLHPRHGDHHLG